MGVSSLNFGLPFFLRVLLPGGVAAVAALPLVAPPLERALALLGLGADASRVVLLSVLTLGFGLVLWSLDDPIYELFEGRRWPRALSAPLIARWQRHVDRLLERERQLDKTSADGAAENDEIWYELRQFPVDEKQQPVALMPTKVGNIMTGYEAYPGERYGMDAVFYWPRLALSMDKDTREEIDRQWAGADAWMHTAAALTFVGLAYLAVGTLAGLFPQRVQDVCMTWARSEWAVLGLALIASAYLPYRLSWAFHLRNGERFKAAFDLFGKRLDYVQPMPKAQRTAWRKRWFELQYGEPRAPRPAGTASSDAPTPLAAPAPLAFPPWLARAVAALGPGRPIVVLLALVAVGFGLATVSGLPQSESTTVGVLLFALLIVGAVVGPALNRAAGLDDVLVTRGHVLAPPFGTMCWTLAAALLLVVISWSASAGNAVFLPLPQALFAGLSAGVLEELAARVAILGGILGFARLVTSERHGSGPLAVTAVILSALAFAALHYAGGTTWSPASALQYTTGGLALGFVYLRLGLGAAIVAHGFADALLYTLPFCA